MNRPFPETRDVGCIDFPLSAALRAAPLPRSGGADGAKQDAHPLPSRSGGEVPSEARRRGGESPTAARIGNPFRRKKGKSFKDPGYPS